MVDLLEGVISAAAALVAVAAVVVELAIVLVVVVVEATLYGQKIYSCSSEVSVCQESRK